jgi:hypothetical protein
VKKAHLAKSRFRLIGLGGGLVAKEPSVGEKKCGSEERYFRVKL